MWFEYRPHPVVSSEAVEELHKVVIGIWERNWLPMYVLFVDEFPIAQSRENIVNLFFLPVSVEGT